MTATAIETARLLVVKKEDFYDIIRVDPRTAVKLLWSFVQVLAERLRNTTAELSNARHDQSVDDGAVDVMFDE